MILKASQRAGAGQLSRHLLNRSDNDQVRVLELRGFMADQLGDAFREVQAIASGTRCQQYLFSLSMNPPKGAEVGEAAFEAAADKIEATLNLSGQPRAIVLHEKEGRRHAHVVWSRIDPAQMRAINLPHFKTKLMAVSRDLYLEHGWALPDGLRQHGGRNPLNFTLAEWQQAKRLGHDPREIKALVQDLWQRADGQSAFVAALETQGMALARGDRRGAVVVDVEGQVYALSRALNLKAKDLRARINPETLESVAVVKDRFADALYDRQRSWMQALRQQHAAELRPLHARQLELRALHRAERMRQSGGLAARWEAETKARSASLRTGLMGLVDRLTGRAVRIRAEHEQAALLALRRDQRARDDLVLSQMRERAAFQTRLDKLRAHQRRAREALRAQMGPARHVHTHDLSPSGPGGRPGRSHRRPGGFSLDLT